MKPGSLNPEVPVTYNHGTIIKDDCQDGGAHVFVVFMDQKMEGEKVVKKKKRVTLKINEDGTVVQPVSDWTGGEEELIVGREFVPFASKLE